ncbi:MAG: EscU/YscU/HrcU family type III secretion system export apparatus switch protein [Gammaproteobacteria bacterium]|jgi:flagellar biosynthesis protein
MSSRKPPDAAVALKWNGRGAPKVTAKGRGETATRILELAREHDIPLRHEHELLELLLLVDIDREIPQTLYIAVAEIIAFAYSLKGRTRDDIQSAVTPPGS